MTTYLLRLMGGQRALTTETIQRDTFEGARLYAYHGFLVQKYPNGLSRDMLKVDILHKPDPMVEHWAAIARGQFLSGKFVWSYPPEQKD